jgi:hypothetical protein
MFLRASGVAIDRIHLSVDERTRGGARNAVILDAPKDTDLRDFSY